jgi:hypothetical protein
MGTSSSVFSQIDFKPFVGYNFGASTSYYPGEIKIKGDFTYGGELDFYMDDYTSVQLGYTHAVGQLRLTDYSVGIGNTAYGNVNQNYFLISGMRYFMSGNVQPYGKFGMGMAYYRLVDIDSQSNYKPIDDDAYRFAIEFGLGVKVMINDRIGIDAHVRALAPISYGGVGIGVGTGGASAGVYGGSTFISGDVGGGLVFRLGN